jgi:hypothetical protein
VLDQIPDSQPTLIEKLLIQRPIIPYEDLNMRGQIPRYLELFRDVGMNLSLMYGMSEQGPRMVSMTSDNAIRTAGVGAGLTNFFSGEGQILAGNSALFSFPNPKHVWVVSIDYATPDVFAKVVTCRFTMADHTLSSSFSVSDGERWTFNIDAVTISITNNTNVTIFVRVWMFDYVSVAESVTVAQQQ